MERIEKCRICGKPFVSAMYTVNDNSVCNRCRNEAHRNSGDFRDFPMESQQEYFGKR